ncbi:MAG: chemotaxis response regulator protein-glutamate methylesterase [Anaeromicrobium sp.]|uniref:protein-glutamate methylesterase/protein-glutamine glutaminase n=1 Tax=Anaeromicrobium sp. TaxID=1929132 RepID=UPI0025FCF365|nr:chemotaxis response regulator protein-glutamate methylesterase [Anaeromicrobium sp.]MCT4595602.1 chemotaxis response regulator protein-glutamate methylesterase [Anaeromicrobium sp.]
MLIVDDSAFMRRILSDIINSNEGLEVIEIAKNGKEATAKLEKLQVDVVTMDVEMPIMDGIKCLEWIMENKPLPVVMLSSLTKKGADATLKALELGAVDFITKPTNIFKMNNDDVQREVTEKIKVASQVRIEKKASIKRAYKTKVNGTKSVHKPKVHTTKDIHKTFNNKSNKIIVVGTSTGGPRALQYVIPDIQKNIKGSLLIVQHMPPGFTKSLAKRLNDLSEISVKEAQDNDILMAGCAYIAPGDRHMKIKKVGGKYKIQLSQDRPVSGHRPSVDVLFDSAANEVTTDMLGVIMTGMGSDGAKGMVNLKSKGAITIAQDEESCVVYGMPKSAVNLGCVDKIVSLQDIADEINKIVGV